MASQALGFNDLVRHVREKLKPRNVLDAGGCFGSLAGPLRAFGIDVAGLPSLDAPISGKFDLVLCLGTLDGLDSYEAANAVRVIAPCADRILFAAAPQNGHGRPPLYWLKLFQENGFEADLTYEPAAVAPTPMLFRRGASDPAQKALMLHARLLESQGELRELRKKLEDRLAAQNREAVQRHHQLDERQRRLENAIGEIRDYDNRAVERLNGHILQLQSRMLLVQNLVQSILRSRIWRTMVMVGGWLLRLAGHRQDAPLELPPLEMQSDKPAASTTAASVPVIPTGPLPEVREGTLAVHSDSPSATSTDVLSGMIVCRGWAVATSGLERIELLIGDQPPLVARHGLYRPDLVKAFPGIAEAERAGWQVNLDTHTLTNGQHMMRVRAVSRKGNVTEQHIPLRVDHAEGYASEYYRWIAEFERRDPELIEIKMAGFERRPRISVLVPVFRTAPEILSRTIESVLRQSYPNWELCLADDCSQQPEVDELLARYATADTRIRYVQLNTNGGISKATNAALAMATGDYIALLDHDDEFTQDALFYVVDAINKNPGAGIYYSDEDHIDEAGLRHDPFFKPDWSADLILSENYVCHLMVLRHDLVKKVGGFRTECDLSQDHDILLRVSRETGQVVHIPRILYHWRTTNFSMNRASNSEKKAMATSLRAVEDHAKALNPAVTVEPGAVAGRWRVRYPVAKQETVSIVMPCGGKLDLLERCLNSIVETTDYERYEIVIVDNSRADKVKQFTDSWKKGGHTAAHLDWRNRPFNFSAMCNDGARASTGSQLLFLNDDVTVINSEWMTAMVEHAQRPEVGAVGVKLLYPDGRIQHAGLVVGLLGVAGHGFKGSFGDQRHYFDFPDVVRNVSAVTGACLMSPAAAFWEVGGYDAEVFPVAYNDVDLCLKLIEKKYRVIYTPHAQLYHYEAFSKRSEDMDPRPSETKAFKTKWKDAIERDPFYNPNLTTTDEDYSYRKKVK